jgi:hypothetical protein
VQSYFHSDQTGYQPSIVFAVLTLIFVRRKTLIRPLALVLAITAGTTIFNSLVVVGEDPINTHYAQEWMRNDISCYAASPAGAGWVEKNMPGVGTTQSWASPDACTFLNRYGLAPEDREKSYAVVPAAWRKLALSDPAFVLKHTLTVITMWCHYQLMAYQVFLSYTAQLSERMPASPGQCQVLLRKLE